MKLYWRIKKNGKWTWIAACPNYVHQHGFKTTCCCTDQDQELVV